MYSKFVPELLTALYVYITIHVHVDLDIQHFVQSTEYLCSAPYIVHGVEGDAHAHSALATGLPLSFTITTPQECLIDLM